MSQSRYALVAIAAYVLFAALLNAAVLPPLAAAIVAAPYALFIPAGLGFILCFGWTRSIPYWLGRVQALCLAWLFGALAIIYTYVVLERYGYFQQLGSTFLLLIYIFAGAGILLLTREILPRPEDKGSISLVLAIAVPMVLYRYAADLFVFSDFPVIDLFQRAHFHAGAFAIAKYDALNPFIADSYIPFQQLLLGLLLRGANADPLFAEWVMPIALAPLQICAVFALITRLTESRFQLGLALALSLALLGFSNPTNGDLTEIAALLVLSLLLPPGLHAEAPREICEKLFVFVAAFGIGVLIFRIPVLAAGFVLMGFTILFRYTKSWPHAQHLSLLALTVLISLMFHRAALLFMTLVAGIYILGIVGGVSSKRGRFGPTWVWISAASALFVVLMIARILLNEGSLPQDEFGLWASFDYLLQPLTGKRMANVFVDSDLAQGAGGRIALFEIARKFSLVCVFIAGIALLRSVLVALGYQRHSLAREANGQLVNTLILGCLLLVALTLTGFPFVHRAAFFINTLLAILVALFVAPSSDPKVCGRGVSSALIVYMGALLATLLVGADQLASAYLNRLYPLLVTLFAVAILITIRPPAKVHVAARFGVLLVLAVLFETTSSRGYYKPYAFSKEPPPANEPISHYGHKELAMANRIAEILKVSDILVSDPKTMALLSARSGNAPLVAFSNLNTMDDGQRDFLNRLLRRVIAHAADIEICSFVRPFIDSKGSGQFNYIRVRNSTPSKPGRDALFALNYANTLLPRPLSPEMLNERQDAMSKRAELAAAEQFPMPPLSMAIVISPDTLDWIRRPTAPSYFPVQGNVLERAKALSHNGNVGRVVEGALLIHVECK